jgi:LysR substrate binding domain
VGAAELTLSEYAGLRRGALTVQASQTIASYWLPKRLVAFGRAHPPIEIHLAVGNTAQVAAAVAGGTAELGSSRGKDQPSCSVERENNANGALFRNHKPSATQRSMGVANGAWFNARARMQAPMVAVNQFGVNWRTTPSKRRAARGRVDVEAMAMVMVNGSGTV